MGGTSFDIGLVPADGVKHYDFMPVIDRWLVSVPMIHLVTLGAGRRLDRQLRPPAPVASRSARAAPGPTPGPPATTAAACCPPSPTRTCCSATSTPERYAGGQIKLNPQRAEFAIDEEFGDHLDLEPVEVARLIKAEVDEQMANGMAKELRIRGYLPAEFTMLAYGGNGPLHCCGIARHLGIDKVLAPPYSSVFSALGAGNMPQLHIHERSVPLVFFDASTKALFTDFDALQRDRRRARGQGPGRPAAARGCRTTAVQHRLELDMRYGNQLVTMAVVARKPRLDGIGDVVGADAAVRERLRAAVRQGQPVPRGRHPDHHHPGRVATCRATPWSSTRPRRTGAPPAAAPVGSAALPLRGIRGPVDTPVFDESALEPGRVVPGPAIVTTPTTTYLVEPGWRIETGAHGAIWFLANPREQEDRR